MENIVELSPSSAKPPWRLDQQQANEPDRPSLQNSERSFSLRSIYPRNPRFFALDLRTNQGFFIFEPIAKLNLTEFMNSAEVRNSY